MNNEKITSDLKPIKLLFNEPLSNFTYTKTGGPADCLLFPKSTEEVKQIIDYCNEENLPWLCLGNASNLIVRDGGIEGFVIMLSDINQVTITDTTIKADAGAKLIDVTYDALAKNLTGLEFACGIPGSIGGAAYMNAGAYGGELVDVFESAEIILEDGSLVTYTKEDMDFSYRHSVLQTIKGIVLNVTFQLKKGNHADIKTQMDELTHLRESKQPLEYPSCGSVFKRPEGHFTGKLIQDAKLQGLKWGGAQISTKHAGFIVNVDGATATDYVELIKHIQKTILETFDVVLETEVRIIGREK
ncbi:UDP-N-acetylmuramate dehydrogenase [Vagococcus carniphilus]|uniref:UDP-N-acetylenolpyruvoylglucosamine reductase n=1 Tax=Vagococcus carniphilus TaxID=218144 RepID=A0AAW8UDR9_9ENTE|nr:UDP-N-acetylmuramate dehydrogenase [Vagococcus carniphilus]MDT2831736.1 UDP-N-acetylmuramate dehydrogenase [Vagococcus carniphilus]MDT2835105.1 UDP-N-acetylmuramate dehydrogenase [Vagococcus carniphilus]MDT2840589.1 UDP-N-acetylmuramate dehydrogenase [Vagococcus carniphilus]MDT2855247.1 UDP-N-acetylmuramate dehydrogenase [Vagococcus carniphilus]